MITRMDTFARDLRYAVRALVRMRGTAIVAILTLALGIGATTTMFSVVYAMLLRPPPFAESERLVILFNTRVTPTDGLVRLRWSMPNIVALRSSATSFETVASFTGALLSTSGHGDPEHIEGEVVSPDYFRTLRVTPVAGRAFRAEEGTVAGAQPVTMISWRLWQRKFAGDSGSVGGTIVVNDVPLTIVGILPEGFSGPQRQGRALDSAADGGAPHLLGIPDDAAELHQRRGAVEGRRDARAGERGAGGDWLALHRQRIGGGHRVGRDDCPASRGAS